jgi:hypothetical protein
MQKIGLSNDNHITLAQAVSPKVKIAFKTRIFGHATNWSEGKAVPVTGRGGPQGCERSRLTDGGKVVRFTRRPSFTPRKIPGTHFC